MARSARKASFACSEPDGRYLGPINRCTCGADLPPAKRCRELTCKQPLAYHRAVGDVYRALADPTRRAILDELTDRDDQTLFEICSRLVMKHGIGASRQAISQHLDVLTDAGLVRTRRSGRYKFHTLDTAPLREIGERWPQRQGEPDR